MFSTTGTTNTSVRLLGNLVKIQENVYLVKGKASVISSNPTCKDGISRSTTVLGTLKALSDQV